jgi:hypothetical protein
LVEVGRVAAARVAVRVLGQLVVPRLAAAGREALAQQEAACPNLLVPGLLEALVMVPTLPAELPAGLVQLSEQIGPERYQF